MATEKEDPKTREKKEPKVGIRDLKPRKEVKGGARKQNNVAPRSPGTTGEIDFMGWE